MSDFILQAINTVKQSTLCVLPWIFFTLGMCSYSFATPPTLVLSDTPLYISSGRVHPNLLLDLSVEFPTVKAAYANASDYNKATEYLGYFNSKKCYLSGGVKNFVLANSSGFNTVDANGNATRFASWSDMQNGYFYVVKDADTNHECDGASFSGNFMNWASASAIDMLRLSLTGGDRVVDNVSQTILQRAFLPSGFYNSGYFPKKIVSATSTMSAPGKVTPYQVAKLYVLNCENKIIFSDVDTQSSCAATRTYPSNNASSDIKLYMSSDRGLGEFLVRVQVCDSSESNSRIDLCMQYPGGNYKPVGHMQRYQNSVRYGAFGYLLDNANTRYGGVLRAPVKYIGSLQYQASSGFLAEPNDRPEWDSVTGIFVVNPEKDLSGNSGVINYLNKFGRSGNYKTYDPLSELYYESIRYLQGNSPTPESTNGMTIAMRDNFQVVTKWVDPIVASCQRNYIVAIGDANTHQDTYIPGTALTGANRSKRAVETSSNDASGNARLPAFDVKAQTDVLAAMESSAIYGNSNPYPNLSNMSTSYTGSVNGTFYLAGIAYWAHTNDIRFDKPVRVKTFTLDVDESGNGSIDNPARVNTGPRVSQLYLAAKYGGFNDVNGDKNPFKTFASDGKSVVNNNSEWASGNKLDPDNFFLASDPKKMMKAINTIFQSVTSSGGTLSGVGISSSMMSDNPYVYEPGFSSNKWSGSLLKKSVINANLIPEWDAGQILTGNVVEKIAPFPAPEDRQIYTARINTDGSLKMTPFLWADGSNFSAADQEKLNTDQSSGVIDNLATERIKYLRGDRSLESHIDGKGMPAGRFRTRDSVLGDIINSTPSYYGAPAKNVSGPGYTAFYNRNAARKKAVYVGANDGFLHAFDADNGKELFAYAPNALIPQLSNLTDPSYTHQSFVDGKIVIKDVQIKENWATVLISGMGNGAKGLFALDVTRPDHFAEGYGALWEFTDKTDPDMGNLVSAPLIAKFRVGGTASNPTYGNFAVVSSGYNNYGQDKGSGQGAIFFLSLDKMPDEPWVLNSNYFKLMTPVKDATQANGLGAPNVTYGGDGAVNNLYVGDLQGNLWRFSFITSGFGNIPKTPTLLFSAKSANGKAQAITVQPQIVFAPGGGYLVLFGTGKYLEANDIVVSNFVQNSYYAIFDTTYNADVVTGRSQLVQRVMIATANGYAIAGKNFSYGTKSGSNKGWYVDFVNSQLTGERIHHDLPGTVVGNYYGFNSMTLTGNPCSPGSGRRYLVDVLTGLSLGETGLISGIGLHSAPVTVHVNTTVSDRNATGSRRVTSTFVQKNYGPNGNETLALPDVITRAGRLSWRELQNYQELRKDALSRKTQ
ncbi:pilus assembly protein PilY [Undibacterium jejuense]|uniref:Pilus assembly protein PilY n=1 Tax=Undibacterium jejuense TaxID=1344949 RepID=A0A923HKK8_9BURK|nr:PilC/PilY family type IV pilus protein [Undibacterium jejuense]MBC3864168.1 pilus assembly protein PilY [Undibacterium jejuense]